ncbi:Alpha N-terminal protein methyltransferase 1 [Lignoscripta atroalba]|nr:Alpha N-terminal protein methyltransferase 1 [Lignoscripta atroalba]
MVPSSAAPDSQVSQTDALNYWNTVSPTVDGMLGGYPQISRIDLRGSASFLAKLKKQTPSSTTTAGPMVRGVDCGAGIGRVTAGLLSKVCGVVDMVEPVGKFAKETEGVKMTGSGRIGKVYVVGLQDWVPENKYDIIWNQWCLPHLTDVELVGHFKRCRAAVTEGGWIVVKENMSTNQDGEDIFDEEDSSVTRTDRKYRMLFEEAGLNVVRTELQMGFPKGLGLFPVRLYGLKPLVMEDE